MTINNGESVKPVESLQAKLDKRKSELGTETGETADYLLLNGGEQAAASFMAAHGALNDLMRYVAAKKYIPGVSLAAFEAIRNLADSIGLGDSSQAHVRQETIANNPLKLGSEVKNAVSQVTNGNVGPSATRMATDMNL